MKPLLASLATLISLAGYAETNTVVEAVPPAAPPATVTDVEAAASSQALEAGNEPLEEASATEETPAETVAETVEQVQADAKESEPMPEVAAEPSLEERFPNATPILEVREPYRSHSSIHRTPHPFHPEFEWADLFIHSLEIGYRQISSREFEELMKGDRQTRIGTYFGTINELKPNGEDASALYFQYAPIPYFGIGITSDDMSLATKDGPTPQETDGDVKVDSDMQYIFFRLPLDIPETQLTVTPFIEFGKVEHDVSFDAEPTWASRGNAVTLADDDSTYTAYGIEFTYNIDQNHHISGHAIWRDLDLYTTGEYTVADGRAPVPIEMNLNNEQFGMGVKYSYTFY